MKYFLALAIPSVVGLSLLSRPLLTILSTPEIAAQGYLITPFVAICALLYGIYTIAIQEITLHKKTKYMGFIWLVAAGLNVLLNVIFIPIFGIIGAAVTTLISFGIATSYIVYHSNLFSIVNIESSFISKCCVSSLILGFLIIFISPGDIVEILVTVLCSTGIYFMLLFALKGFSKDEFAFFKNIFR
jgi:O-antigen/teichoic acid export membrane protein